MYTLHASYSACYDGVSCLDYRLVTCVSSTSLNIYMVIVERRTMNKHVTFVFTLTRFDRVRLLVVQLVVLCYLLNLSWVRLVLRSVGTILLHESNVCKQKNNNNLTSCLFIKNAYEINAPKFVNKQWPKMFLFLIYKAVFHILHTYVHTSFFDISSSILPLQLLEFQIAHRIQMCKYSDTCLWSNSRI